MHLSEILKDLALCKKRLKKRTAEVSEADINSLKYDILLMEIELLKMLITNLQECIDKRMKLRLTQKTRNAVFSIKPTIN